MAQEFSQEPWSNALRKMWRETWDQPHMQQGLREILNATKKKPVPLVAGYDALVLAAGAHHLSLGHQEVLDLIKSLGNDIPAPSQMPQPFTREARGENNPNQQ